MRGHAGREVTRAEGTQEIDDWIVLATERDPAVLLAGQAHPRLTAKLAAALPELSRTDVEAVFQLEDGGQTAAQIFLALEAPTVAGPRAAGERVVRFVLVDNRLANTAGALRNALVARARVLSAR